MKRYIVAVLLLACFVAWSPVAAQGTTVVVLVRHAEKTADPGNDQPLTADGEARARALADALSDAGIQKILATPRRRTRDTAAPLAQRLGIPVDTITLAGGGAANVQATARAVREGQAGQTILIVGHSNTIPAIIGALGGPKLPDLCDSQHATLYVLLLPSAGKAQLITSRYGRPDPEQPTGCPTMQVR